MISKKQTQYYEKCISKMELSVKKLTDLIITIIAGMV